MKAHTVGDLRNLALDIKSKGMIANEMLETAHLEEIEQGQLSRMGGRLN